MKTLMILVFYFAFASEGLAQQLKSDDQWALQQVQKMLTNPIERQQEIGNSPAAQDAHKDALQAVGSSNIDELYAISAIVMEDLVRMSGGDALKMQVILQNAKSNPGGFYGMLSPRAIEAIKKLAPKAGGKSS